MASEWGALDRTRERSAALNQLMFGVVALLLAIVAFQAVAAGRLPAAALIGAPLILFLDGAAARYRARRA